MHKDEYFDTDELEWDKIDQSLSKPLYKMANNIRVHTDANFRIRDGLGTVMRSSRMLNQNNCMQDRSLRRNIISNHFVSDAVKRHVLCFSLTLL